MNQTYYLYGVPASYYTAKARAFMRKQGLAFEERSSAHPEFGAVVFPATSRMFLPCLQTPDGTIVQDSDDILAFLEDAAPIRLSATPPGPVQAVLSHVFNLFGSEGLTRMAMHYRWSMLDQQDSFIAAGFIHGLAPESPPEEADALARPMMNKLASYLTALGVTPETVPKVEAAYDALLDALQAHFTRHPCLFGAWPSLGDYGLYGPLFAHLGRDPVPAFHMKQRADKVFRWTERVSAPNLDIPEYPSYPYTEFILDDAVPETLLAIGRVAAGEMIPELPDQVSAFNAWAAGQDRKAGVPLLDKPHKRAVGTVETHYRGSPVRTGVSPYRIYLLQKVQNAFDALDGEAKTRARTWFGAAGLTPLLDARPDHRVGRKANLEVWAD